MNSKRFLLSCGFLVEVYVLRKIKNTILTNSLGLEKKDNYFIASRERAFLDTVYLNKNYYFDNMRTRQWRKD